ncbi:hypothetical protein F5883DRAFT_99598 [Diaporthe sp. PMI_573]|nr:hypothetical protein F5883DRAFT_99598 [Diaporthaceae sp. PMI_573]
MRRASYKLTRRGQSFFFPRTLFFFFFFFFSLSFSPHSIVLFSAFQHHRFDSARSLPSHTADHARHLRFLSRNQFIDNYGKSNPPKTIFSPPTLTLFFFQHRSTYLGLSSFEPRMSRLHMPLNLPPN